MAHIEVPDFSDVDDETVHDAFAQVWDGFRAEAAWLKTFKAQIVVASRGAVELQDADANDFSVRVKGPAEYLMLVRGSERQKVILGPYSHPVEFVD